MERGFVYLFINIVATIMMKGLNLAFSLDVLSGNRRPGFIGEEDIYWRPAYWFLFHVMPQFSYVSWNELLKVAFVKDPSNEKKIILHPSFIRLRNRKSGFALKQFTLFPPSSPAKLPRQALYLHVYI